MAKHFSGGISFGSRSKAAILDLGSGQSGSGSADRISPVVPDESNDKIIPWVRWGSDNLLPAQMIQDIGSCGILSSIIEGKARFALCNGVLPALVRYDKTGQMVIEEIVVASEIDEFLEENNHFYQTFGWAKDICGFSNLMARFLLDVGRKKIVSFQRDDITEMRFEKMDKATGIIKNVYLSAEWQKVGNNPKDQRLSKINLLNPSAPLKDLREKANDPSAGSEFAITYRTPGWGKKYYSTPMWYAALKWVRIAQGVPEMKAAMFENNMRPKYMVIISPQYWEKVFNAGDKSANDYTDEEIQKKKQALYDEIDQYLAGNHNAFKTVFCDSYVAADGTIHPDIEIKAIEDTTKEGQLLPDSAAANSEIAFAMLFNPAIIGASMPSGPYTNSQGGSNVRESTLIQVIIHEFERQQIRSIFNVIKRFNGWDKEYGKDNLKLEFIIPATIPTTLDTGSNVKQMITGISPNNPS